MVSGTVGTGTDKPLPTVHHLAEWKPGGIPLRLTAHVFRNGRMCEVKVLHLSSDRERAFVRFVNDRAQVTAWLSVDELEEG